MQRVETERLREATGLAMEAGLIVNAGHGINYENIAAIRTIPGLAELNIGHSIVARAMVVGMERAVSEMVAAMRGDSVR
jgi:pyridoxine 5-phosphate synthase